MNNLARFARGKSVYRSEKRKEKFFRNAKVVNAYKRLKKREEKAVPADLKRSSEEAFGKSDDQPASEEEEEDEAVWTCGDCSVVDETRGPRDGDLCDVCALRR